MMLEDIWFLHNFRVVTEWLGRLDLDQLLGLLHVTLHVLVLRLLQLHVPQCRYEGKICPSL